MASPNDPDKPSRRARANGASPTPAGAHADGDPSQPNTVTEEGRVEVGRNARGRASGPVLNAIQAAADGGSSKTATNQPQSSIDPPMEPPHRQIPERVAKRYVQVGEDYRFPDGTVAFRDEGSRLYTKLENREVIRDLIAIAQERGWSIQISGTKEFQRRAWQEAQVAGLTVRDYEPTELERQQLAQRMSRERSTTPQATPPGASAVGSPGTTSSPAEPPAARDPAPPPAAADRIYRGRLVDHGIDRYQFDPRNEESYYVILDTPDHGEQVIWGKDLQRALEQSLSKPQGGQDVVVRQLGAKPCHDARPTLRCDEGR